MTHSDRAGMEEVSKSAVRKCCIVSSARYATRCCTSYGFCTLAYLTSIIKVSPCLIPCRLSVVSRFSDPIGLFREVNIALIREPGVTRRLLPISSSRMAGVSRSEKEHGMGTFHHSTMIFCIDTFRGRLFFG